MNDDKGNDVDQILSAFDAEWYIQQYPDVSLLGMDPADHYRWIGKKLGRKPNASGLLDTHVQVSHQILKRFEGLCPETDYLCLFSHYDMDNKIDPYVIYYLQSLKDCGFSITFITTCEEISRSELGKIENLVHRILVKKNIGRDFGAWFAGVLESWEKDKYKKVLLANDSVYGPLFDLKEVFEDMSERSLDLWGLTDSIETDYHIQSYFVVFEEKIANSSFFEEFWNSYEFETEKRKVIENYEIGLTSLARKNGFEVGSLCNYYDVRRQALRLIGNPNGTGNTTRQSKLTPVNSSHFFWRALIQNFYCPFVKVELLRDNPSRIDDIYLWEEVISSKCDYSERMISNHIKRVKRNF